MICHERRRLLLQFHITGRCNLRCKHCYRTEGDTEPLSTDDVINVIEQYKKLLCEYNRRHGIKRRGHINITGGEPFFRSDIKKILAYLGENKEHFSYGVLSNGSFIDDGIIFLLKNTEIEFLQLSIDGDRVTHDGLRATGDYDRVFQVAQRLERAGIPTYISFTANRENYRFLPKVAKECRKRGITKLWSDRLVSIGNGEGLSTIEAGDMRGYLRALKKAQGNIITRMLYPKTKVTMNRALQFMGGGFTYSCSAGRSLLTVDEFGNVMPCRRMPKICGNVFSSSLTEIYYENEFLKSLRRCEVSRECAGCKHAFTCGGGARCQSYAKFGDPFKRDPACMMHEQIKNE